MRIVNMKIWLFYKKTVYFSNNSKIFCSSSYSNIPKKGNLCV